MLPPWAGRARLLAGLLLLGQGLLVVTRVLDHEAPLVVGGLLVAAGALVAAGPRLLRGGTAGAEPPAPASPRKALLVAGLGAGCAAAVVAYNLFAGSALAAPELALLLYGCALLLASPHLARRVRGVEVGQLVAFSFPLVMAPLGLYALDAFLKSYADAAVLTWYIQHTLVAPMAALLALSGLDVATFAGNTVRLLPARGPLFLTVGVVCAGLYASVLFLGVFGLFAWESRTPPRRLAAYLGAGLAGLHAMNVLRLVLLGLVGYAWGGKALQDFHQHAGWALFIAWTVLFWALVLRRWEGPPPAPPRGA